MDKIKVGLVGAGYFGNFHLKNLLLTPFEVIGFHDTDKSKAEEIFVKYNIKYFDDFAEMIEKIDALVITSMTTSHFEYIKEAIKYGKNVFVEKPMTTNSNEAEEIYDLMEESKLKLQVGHIERFNPVIQNLNLSGKKIINMEMNRYATFNPRGTDVSVIFDLMIHDIDLMLYLKREEIVGIEACGLEKYGNNLEYASACITYADGSKVTLNASIIHPYNERKIKIWTESNYFELDLNAKRSFKISYLNQVGENNNIIESQEDIQYEANNAILEELTHFHDCIHNDTPVDVNHLDGYNAIIIAEQILNKI